MRNALKTILIFALLSVSVLSNTGESGFENVNTESVNIRGMLDKQINEIRKREKTLKNNSAEKINVAESGIVDDQVNGKAASVLTEEKKEVKDSLKSVFLFVELSLLVLLGYTVKKRYDKINKLKVIELKRNVKDLREEKIGSFANKELSLLRMKLNNTKINVKDSSREITQKAKSLAISKGEIHLAAKIKMMTQFN
ncbi:MAG: hypothetical protein PVH88_01560 [Ignavibacteria bacterium]|jgi:hypothetical protein